MDCFEILERLTSRSGTPGSESEAAQTARELLQKYLPTHLDALGSVIGDTGAQGEKILLDAHLDQIGMVVTAVDEKGFVKVAKCGGADPLVLAAAEVIVHGKQDLYGVVTSTPPHLSKDGEKKACDFDEIAVDIGMKKDEADRIVSPGDRITFVGQLKRMLDKRVCGASLDDRSGVASILRCLEILGDRVRTMPVRVQFSVCEETGGSGATTGGYSAEAYESIAVDVSFAKAPGSPDDVRAELGKGTMVGFAPTLNREMSLRLKKIAEDNNIKYQNEVMGGRTGTNADEICTAGAGTRCALLSIPLRNMHTAAEVIDLDDVEGTAQLMAAYILGRGGVQNA